MFVHVLMNEFYPSKFKKNPEPTHNFETDIL